jgi:hypothetical protein
LVPVRHVYPNYSKKEHSTENCPECSGRSVTLHRHSSLD